MMIVDGARVDDVIAGRAIVGGVPVRHFDRLSANGPGCAATGVNYRSRPAWRSTCVTGSIRYCSGVRCSPLM